MVETEINPTKAIYYQNQCRCGPHSTTHRTHKKNNPTQTVVTSTSIQAPYQTKHTPNDYKEFKPKSSYDDDKAPDASSCTGAGAGVGTGSGARNQKKVHESRV